MVKFLIDIGSNKNNFSQIDNIFVMFSGRVFQQTVGISMGTNCALLLADFFFFLFLWGRLFTGAFQEKQKETNQIF